MPIVWKVKSIQISDEGNSSNVAWRIEGDGGASLDGVATVDNLVIEPSTTEQDVIEKVKHAINATSEQRDENGNLIPPLPDAKSRTDEIEASVAAQAHEIAHPKTKSVDLPWKAA